MLLVEDVEDDARLIEREISRAGYDVVVQRVDTAETMATALDAGEWDVVIADHSLPGFTGFDALALVRQRQLDVPFILVSGTIDEDTAVGAMRAGAHDYVMKGNLRRLGPAIQRELHEAQDRRRRAEAEGALEHARDYSRRLIESASAIIIGLDEDGRIALFNRAAEVVTGLSRANVVGKTIFETAIPLEQWPREWQEMGGATEHEAEIPLRTTSGENLIIAWRHARPDGPDAVGGSLLFGIDVTQRRRAEERRAALEQLARRSDRLVALGTLAAGLAHELNNPVGIISSRIELMLLEDDERRALPAEIRADLEVLHRHAQRVAGLAQGLLSFSRQRPRERSPLDLNKVVHDVLLLAAPQVAKSGVTIQVGLHPELPCISGDGQGLQQVVLNLITNAWEALGGSGVITIQTHLVGDPPEHVELVVADTGRGIAAEDQPWIFDAFFTTRSEGTGLGLAITHGIVREHGGTIHVESEPGKGARFIVALPRS